MSATRLGIEGSVIAGSNSGQTVSDPVAENSSRVVPSVTYPTEPRSSIGQPLRDRFNREALTVLLYGSPGVVDQGVIEERLGFCDSYAWSPPLILPENAAIAQPQPGELMRLYKRWYPLTTQRIPL